MKCCDRLAPCESCCNRGRAQLAAKLAHFATRGMVETHGRPRAPTPWSDYVGGVPGPAPNAIGLAAGALGKGPWLG